jgi:hypothetical protein
MWFVAVNVVALLVSLEDGGGMVLNFIVDLLEFVLKSNTIKP